MAKPFGSAISLPKIATPTDNPTANHQFLYFKSDGWLYRKTSTGIEVVASSVQVPSTVTPTEAGNSSAYPATATYWATVTTGGGWPHTGLLTGVRSNTVNAQVLTNINNERFTRIYTGAWSAWQQIVDKAYVDSVAGSGGSGVVATYDGGSATTTYGGVARIDFGSAT